MNTFVRNIRRITCPAFAESRVSVVSRVPGFSTRFQAHEFRQFCFHSSPAAPSGHG
jgi:hypothetical protein